MSKYAIWNGTDTVYTFGPPYKFTPDEWRAKYPWAEVAPCVVSGEGAINGAFCMPLPDMIVQATKQGCDLSACTTDEEKLAAIEAFEEEKAAEAAAAAAAAAEAEAAAAERTTAALEAIAAGQTTENAAAVNALLNGEG